MALYALLGGLLVSVATFFYGINVGVDREVSKRVSQEQIVRDTREAAQQGAADAIAKINVKNVTINRKLETEVRDKLVFRDCRSGDVGVRLYNSAISDGAVALGGGVLPTQNAPAR